MDSKIILSLVQSLILKSSVITQESKLKAARMHIYVRRGGPNYQRGLAKMRALGDEIGIPIEVIIFPISILEPLSHVKIHKNFF